jgi:uncharacterized membrane protein
MKSFFEHIRTRVLAGVIFLIPVFVVVTVVQKMLANLKGAGNYLVTTFGIKDLLGSQAVTVVTALILVLLFYFFGWLVRFSMLTRLRDWLENTLLQYIPGYLTYKAKMQEKIEPTADTRVPVMVSMQNNKRPALLIEENAGEATVFFPNSPDTNNGQVMVVSVQQITRLNDGAAAFIKNMQRFGKGLK